jgi:hypothetical protein
MRYARVDLRPEHSGTVDCGMEQDSGGPGQGQESGEAMKTYWIVVLLLTAMLLVALSRIHVLEVKIIHTTIQQDDDGPDYSDELTTQHRT